MPIGGTTKEEFSLFKSNLWKGFPVQRDSRKKKVWTIWPSVPNDLRFSLERNPGYPLRDPDDCIRNVVELVEDINIPLCYALPTVGEKREKYQEMGMRVFWEQSKLKQ